MEINQGTSVLIEYDTIYIKLKLIFCRLLLYSLFLSLYSTATEKVALGPGVGLDPQRHYLALGIPTCLYLKMLKFAFPPTQNPNTSQWNIGCVGSLTLGLCVGHVHFIFFVVISFALGSRRKCSFQWNMGLNTK